jgi:murein DD-endopeptidase MepM/ murein hydrolase activator NlpD
LEIKFALKKLIPLLSWLLLASIFIGPFSIAQAQSQPNGPTYIVQSGDTLNLIALRFGVSTQDLIQANQLADPNNLQVGMQLIIPGLQGIVGILNTLPVNYGDTLRSVSLRYQVSEDLLIKLNRITSPEEVYAGSNLIVPQSDQTIQLKQIGILPDHGTNLEMAAEQGLNPWTLVEQNLAQNNAGLFPGNQIFSTGKPDQKETNPVSAFITKLDITPFPLVQGKTTEITIQTTQPVNLSGKFGNYPLQFFQNVENTYVALQGIHAMTPPGLLPTSLTVTTQDGTASTVEQFVPIDSGNYAQDPSLTVDPETVDPAVTGPEDKQVADITSKVTPDRLWTDGFKLPLDQPICIKSWFGSRRSYNGGPYNFFHAGIDYGVCASLNIYAAAPGEVVFTGPLIVRGNTTIINHGWGVFTAYFHQSEIDVKVGDKVEAGQQIGLIGKTGRVNGPHLHFEIWVNGAQVNPQDWLDRVYP